MIALGVPCGKALRTVYPYSANTIKWSPLPSYIMHIHKICIITVKKKMSSWECITENPLPSKLTWL